jgi:enoyl-CoA hydratase
MHDELILAEKRGSVGLVTFNRPEAKNALNNQMLHQLMQTLESDDEDDSIGAMVLTGNDKAFAAGADIKEMADLTAREMLDSQFIATFGRIDAIRKPLVAAVSGWALGGGCEIALACDVIIASDTAKFGQPEVNIGVIPGAGGTQRLPRAVGKSWAMEMILNNRTLSAQEALQRGMVSRVVPVERYLEEAIGLAQEIASHAPLAIRLARKLIREADQTPLTEGIQNERDAFHDLFGTEDRREGMRAFVEKRSPVWRGK